MARGSEVTIVFPVMHWKGILNKRGTSPEEKGYYFLKEVIGGNKILSLFNFVEAVGSNVEVSSSEIALNAIRDFTAIYGDIHIIPYHTHPIDGPSSGDERSYIQIFEKTRGQIRDFLTIGPQTVEIDRVYPPGTEPRIRDIVNMDSSGNPQSNLVKIIAMSPERDAQFKKLIEDSGKEFHALFKRYR